MRVRHLLWSGAVIGILLASCGDDDGNDTNDAAGTVTSGRMTASDVAAAELVTGDCVSGLVIGAAERRTIDSAHVVDCESVHELEVFATFDLSSEDFEISADSEPGVYPGEQRVVMAADEGCASRLEALGVEQGVGVIAIWPTDQSWTQGDRGVVCAAYSSDGRPFEERHLLSGEAP